MSQNTENRGINGNMRALPEDLIANILVKLPVKSLLRFRCVHTSWNHLIRSSDFIKKHLKYHSTKKEFVLFSCIPQDPSTSPLSLHSYDPLNIISPDLRIPEIGDDVYTIKLCGPCNGLVCISINQHDIIICNPSSREFKLLQSRPFLSPLGFTWYDIAIGFGFDSWTQDYKVMRIIQHYDMCDIYFTVEVYNFSSHSWRIFENHRFQYDNPPPRTPGTYWNEAIHWVNYSQTEILSFDLKTEVFQSIMLPFDPQEEERKKMNLTVLNESLALFSWTGTFRPTEQFIDLWVIEDYGVENCWTKLFTVGPLIGIEAPLILWKDEAIILEVLGMSLNQGKLYTCSIATLETVDLLIDGKSDSYGVLICNESLTPIN